MNNEAEITRLIHDWAQAVRNRDLSAILAGHSPDILMFDLPPPLQSKGIDEYKKTWDLFFSLAPDPVVFDISELSVVAGEEVAFAAAIMRCSERKPNGEILPLIFRLTIGLRKIDRRWTITHEHHSIPAES
jgi:ketosteroid isomerase-like protein